MDVAGRPAPRVSVRADGGIPRTITLIVPYRPPYDWAAMRAHFAARAVPGIEAVDARGYRRVVRCAGAIVLVAVAPCPERDALRVRVRSAGSVSRAELSAQLRRVFDLDADIAAIGRELARDAALAPLVRRRPGLRVPGTWDAFELAMRAVLGQQVTVAAARTLAARLVARHGEPVPRALARDDALTHAFPRPSHLAGADFAAIGLPRARAATLAAIVRAALDDASLFAPDADPARTLEHLASLPGIGPWTAQYVALRALRQPDAFPAGDIALQRALARDGTRPTAAALERRAEAWRPWRAYAAQHLWTADAAV